MKTLILLMPEFFAQESYPIFADLLPGINILSISPNEDAQIISNAFQRAHFLIWTGTQITKELINTGTHLQLIQKWGAGIDGIDLSAANERGIWVANVPGGNSNAVSEHFFAMLLSISKRLDAANASLHKGYWTQGELVRQGLWELKDKTLGIVGFGRIGQAIALKAIPFGMSIYYFKRNRLSENEERNYQATFLPLHNLVKQADVIALALPFSIQTKGMFDNTLLHLMKPTSVLINVSRGAILNEKDLYTALTSGHIAAVGLDVFENEPISPDNQLLKLSNVICTPHIAGRTKEAMRFISEECAQNVHLVLKKNLPKYIIREDS